MKTRTVAYATHAVSPITVSSGAIHHLSVRNVLASIAARGRAPTGFVAVVVIYRSRARNERRLGYARQVDIGGRRVRVRDLLLVKMFRASMMPMLRRHGSRAVAALLLTVALTSGAAANTATATPSSDPAVSQLVQTLDGLVANPLLNGSFAAVVVRDAETGETLYDRLGDHRFTP